MLKTFMGTEELQSTYSDSLSETGMDNETGLTTCGQRESVSSSSRGSIGSINSTISDDSSGKNKQLASKVANSSCRYCM